MLCVVLGGVEEDVSLTHFIWDTILVVSDIFRNNFVNIEKYFTESCIEGPR